MIKIYQAELVVRDCLLCKNFLIGFLTQQGHVISLKSYRYVCTCSTNALFSLLICPCITLTLLHLNFFFSHTFSMKVRNYTFCLFKYIVGPYTYNLCALQSSILDATGDTSYYSGDILTHVN